MLWERDYMKRRSGTGGDSGVSATIHAQGAASDPVDIFDGVERQALTSQTPTARPSDDSKTVNSARALSSSAPLATNQPEPPLNRLLAKHPRFFWYAGIAILGIIIGLLLGRS